MSYLAALAASISVTFFVIAVVWLISRGRMLRPDRTGAAAMAVGFVAGYSNVAPGGISLENTVTWLPLLAVAGALVIPRLFSALAPNARVPLGARVLVVLAGTVATALLFAAGRDAAGGLGLAAVGAMLGSALGEALTEGLAPGAAPSTMGGGVSATVPGGIPAPPGAAPGEPATVPAAGVPLAAGEVEGVTAAGPVAPTTAEVAPPGESVAKPPEQGPAGGPPTWERQPVIIHADSERPGTWVLGALLVGVIPVLAG